MKKVTVALMLGASFSERLLHHAKRKKNVKSVITMMTTEQKST
jgi:hypothetical protein